MMSSKRLAIVSTHPIQYFAPLFRELAASPQLALRVYYTWSQSQDGQHYDSGFATRVSWDLPLLEGYSHEFVANCAHRPGLERFSGLRNPTLCASIEDWRPDALLVFGWNYHSHLQAMRYFKGRVPVLFRGDSTLLDERSPFRIWARRIALGWVYRHVDLALAVGSHSRDYFAWCGLPASRVAFAPHCVDNDRFTDPTGSHAQRARDWRQQLHIDEDQPVVLFAGKLQAQKDPLLLLDAWREAGVDAHLVIFGNGELERALRQRALPLRGIHFLPFQNQSVMPAVYRVGDVMVLPSRSETWGLALNEAMACGRAVIASSKVGGARDLVREGVNGWIFESGNPTALAHALRVAVSLGRRQLATMGESGQHMIVDWSKEVCARRIADAVVAVCGA